MATPRAVSDWMAAKSSSISLSVSARRRLVHDQHARFAVERLRHLDHLLLGDAQLLHGAYGIDAHAERGQLLACLALEPRAVDDAEAARGLAAEEDVLGRASAAAPG